MFSSQYESLVTSLCLKPRRAEGQRKKGSPSLDSDFEFSNNLSW